MTYEMHSSLQIIFIPPFFLAVHVSKETSRPSLGALSSILYQAVGTIVQAVLAARLACTIVPTA